MKLKKKKKKASTNIQISRAKDEKVEQGIKQRGITNKFIPFLFDLLELA